jgi:hypothetical protein
LASQSSIRDDTVNIKLISYLKEDIESMNRLILELIEFNSIFSANESKMHMTKKLLISIANEIPLQYQKQLNPFILKLNEGLDALHEQNDSIGSQMENVKNMLLERMQIFEAKAISSSHSSDIQACGKMWIEDFEQKLQQVLGTRFKESWTADGVVFQCLLHGFQKLLIQDPDNAISNLTWIIDSVSTSIFPGTSSSIEKRFDVGQLDDRSDCTIKRGFVTNRISDKNSLKTEKENEELITPTKKRLKTLLDPAKYSAKSSPRKRNTPRNRRKLRYSLIPVTKSEKAKSQRFHGAI